MLFKSDIYPDGNRDRATGFDNASDYIITRIKDIAPQLTVSKNYYSDTLWKQFGAISTSVDGVKLETEPWLITYSAGTDGDLTAPVAQPDIDKWSNTHIGCNASDWVGFPRGSIAVVSRGSCTFCMKARYAQKAGASAIVIHFLENTTTFQISWRFCDNDDDHWAVTRMPMIPSISADYHTGLTMAEATSMTLNVPTGSAGDESHNIIVDIPGQDPDSIFVIGAHLDSVPEGPGINDNGSGSALILEILRVFGSWFGFDSNTTQQSTLRIAWWGSEEWGLIGSTKYLKHLPEAERKKIKGYINFDVESSPDGINSITPGWNSTMKNITTASGWISNELEAAFKFMGEPVIAGRIAGSDYVPFQNQAIPFSGLSAGNGKKTEEQAKIFGGTAGEEMYPCYHALCDNMTNSNFTKLALFTKVAARAVQRFVTEKDLGKLLSHNKDMQFFERANVVTDETKPNVVDLSTLDVSGNLRADAVLV